MQCRARVIEPGPLASFNRWKELGRHVRKGQRALELCMPLKLKAKEWDEKRAKDSQAPTGDGEEPGCRTIFVFKKNWFVLSQTEGAPYEPEPIPAWDKAAALATLNIREEAFALVDGNTQGYAATGAAAVAISPIAAMPHKTLFHEIAHVLLHHGNDDTEKALREVEAECVAMICCESLGLPGVEYSRGYVQHWLCVDSIPEKSAQRIFQAADRVLKAGVARSPAFREIGAPGTGQPRTSLRTTVPLNRSSIMDLYSTVSRVDTPDHSVSSDGSSRSAFQAQGQSRFDLSRHTANP
jgi:antirestriction protein ArdC